MPNYLQDHDFCDILAISSSSAMLKCLSDNNWLMTHPENFFQMEWSFLNGPVIFSYA